MFTIQRMADRGKKKENNVSVFIAHGWSTPRLSKIDIHTNRGALSYRFRFWSAFCTTSEVEKEDGKG